MIKNVLALALVALVVLSIGAAYAWRYYGAPRSLQQQLLGGVVTGWSDIPVYERQYGDFGALAEQSWSYPINRAMCDKLSARFGCRRTSKGTFKGLRCVDKAYPDWCYLFYDGRANGPGAVLTSGGKLILVR